MRARPQEIDLEPSLVQEGSPFRVAFAQARLEGRVAPGGAAVKQSSEKKSKRQTPTRRVDAPSWNVVRFEVRIEKRRGKRSADTSRWNDLGRDGWELVAVVGKQAFFRRDGTGFAP